MGRPKKFSRDGVLERAIPVFWKQGFTSARLEDLETATGVNKSGLYNEFHGKEDLFLASLQHYLETRSGFKVLSQEPLGWNNVEEFLKLGVSFSGVRRGCFAVNSMREIAVLPAEARKMLNGNLDQLGRLLVRNIEVEKPGMAADVIAGVILTFFSGFCIEENLARSRTASLRKVAGLMQVVRAL